MNESVKTWIYATRPHTLGASVAPMLIVLGALIADGGLHFGLYLLCFIVALSAQIASNFANDYFDYIGEKDTSKRIGFERLLQSGKVTPKQMMLALIIALVICAAAGITLVAIQNWALIIIGVLVILGAISYSAGPFPLSHQALGDIAVVFFYGLIPILASYYAINGMFLPYLIPLAFGIGIWEANILVTNNYRDYDEDVTSGKRTLIVRMGKASGPILYLINAVLSVICIFLGLFFSGRTVWAIIIGVMCLFLFGIGVLSIRRLRPSSLNKLLKYTNIVSLIVGFLILIALIF